MDLIILLHLRCTDTPDTATTGLGITGPMGTMERAIMDTDAGITQAHATGDTHTAAIKPGMDGRVCGNVERAKTMTKTMITVFMAVLAGILFLSGEATAFDKASLDSLKGARKCPECDLTHADLYGVNLSRAELISADLSNANLSGTNLSRAELSRANFTGANLTGANLAGADLAAVNLSQANLIHALLSGANLTGAGLGSADLTGANLAGVNLFQANLTGAVLCGVNLSRANLTGANLRGADLYGADLTGANLFQADLTGANLRGTTWTDGKVCKAGANGGCDKREQRGSLTWTSFFPGRRN
jgi:uncharacterized protein YjbI with pentapeptide repeats